MEFYKVPKTEKNPAGTKYSVYMDHDGKAHYVCDMIEGTDSDAVAINNLGLTLRARLTMSKGEYAMLEGKVFNPNRLLKAACSISEYTVEPLIGGIYKDGHTLLTVNADGCVNKYLILGYYWMSQAACPAAIELLMRGPQQSFCTTSAVLLKFRSWFMDTQLGTGAKETPSLSTRTPNSTTLMEMTDIG